MVLVDVVAPIEFILPIQNSGSQLATAKKGTLAISGGGLAFNDGTLWVQGKTATVTSGSGTLQFSGGLLVSVTAA